tara:strand:- start:2 stop:1093 length:1092 start_codon:yes stop_codon:yes gene_type:complete
LATSPKIAIFLSSLIFLFALGAWHISSTISDTDQSGSISVVDSNGVEHLFDETPDRIVLTNTYAASVMRMLGINNSVIVGVSGDFYDETLWPELSGREIVQQSAHSEIDFEALLDSRPDVYIVFATNGMVDTNAIREKLEPVGIRVLALDFFKYDSLRMEIGVIAELFGKQLEAEMLFSEFDTIEGMVANRTSQLMESQRPIVVMEHHASLTRDPVVLTGTSQWTDMIFKAGATNVFADLPGHTTHVDMEAILDANPEVLMFDGIVFDIGFNSYDNESKCETHFDFIRERPGFNNLNAVRNDRMAIMSGEFAGPMMIHGLPTLAKIIHPEIFSDIDADYFIDQYFSKYHGIERIGKFICTSGE